MARKILLMSKFNQENFKLKDILARHLKHDVSWVRTPNQAISMLLSGIAFEVIVINTELFTKKKLEMVQHLRAIGCQYPVLYLADVIKDSLAFIPEHLKTMVVDKPVFAQDLDGIIDRVVTREGFGIRFHKRFSTAEPARFEVFRNGKRAPAVLRNLSLGGAFLETSETYQAGEVIKVWVQLDSLSKAHEMSAKVVWNSQHPQHKGQRGLGIRFVRPGEVYQAAVSDWLQ